MEEGKNKVVEAVRKWLSELITMKGVPENQKNFQAALEEKPCQRHVCRGR